MRKYSSTKMTAQISNIERGTVWGIHRLKQITRLYTAFHIYSIEAPTTICEVNNQNYLLTKTIFAKSILAEIETEKKGAFLRTHQATESKGYVWNTRS